jgi:hypothetical protein
VKRAAGADLRAFLGAFSPGVAQIALRLRALVLDQAKGASEFIDEADGGVAMAYALTENPADAFCRLAIHEDGVDLEFGLGSELPDPERRLEGKGKGARRLRMTSLEDLRQPSVGRFLRAAIQAGEQSKEQTGKRSAPRPVVRGVYAGPGAKKVP